VTISQLILPIHAQRDLQIAQIRLDAEQTARIVTFLQNYFKDKLDSKIGQFDAAFLLDFFSAEVGAFYCFDTYQP